MQLTDASNDAWRRIGRRQIEDRFGGNEELRLRVECLTKAGAMLLAQRPDLNEAFGHDPMGVGFWCWLNTFGVTESALIRDLLVPVPPYEAYRHVGSSTELGFLQTGANAFTMLAGLLARHGRRIEEVRTVLDFGSGPGRVVRYFFRQWESTSIVGCDVDAPAIDWARNNFFFGEFDVNDKKPPLRYANETFDLIYAISVFSHLSESNAVDWLRELKRVATSDATLIVTVMGRHALTRLLEEEAFRAWACLPRADLLQARIGLDKRGFHFVRQPAGHLDRDLYGVAFADPSWIKSKWSAWFDVLDVREAAIDNNQDAVVLRPRS